MGEKALQTMVVVVCLVAATAGVASGSIAQSATDRSAVGASADETDPEAAVQQDNESAPPDPASDVLGWENGVWHNESVSVDVSDDYDRTEVRQLLNRTMARVEVVRGVEFNESVDVNFRTREEYADYVASEYQNVSAAERTRTNVMYEALFFVGEDEDAVAVEQRKSSSFAAAFVSPQPIPALNISKGDVTIVSDGPVVFKERILAHELVHALQVKELNVLGDFTNFSTYDSSRGLFGLVEGDAEYSQYRYVQRCEMEWDCLNPETPAPSIEGGALAMAFLDQVQYAEGPALVRTLKEQGGWNAVREAYESPPASTEQVIHPGKYGSDPPTSLPVSDRSTDAWKPLSVPNSVDYQTYGEAGLFTMLWWPNQQASRSVVIPRQAIINRSQPSTFPLSYSHPATAGWEGDKLVPYVPSNGETNETAYVWKLAWESPADAEEFASAYRDLLNYHNATSVSERANTYRLPEGSNFSDAFTVRQNGSSVVIVNAPTVEQLDAVRAGVTQLNETETSSVNETETSTTTPTETSTTTETATATTETLTDTEGSTEATADESTETATDEPTATPTEESVETPSPKPADTDSSFGFGPGFGPLAVIVAFAGLVLLLRRR